MGEDHSHSKPHDAGGFLASLTAAPQPAESRLLTVMSMPASFSMATMASSMALVVGWPPLLMWSQASFLPFFSRTPPEPSFQPASSSSDLALSRSNWLNASTPLSYHL